MISYQICISGVCAKKTVVDETKTSTTERPNDRENEIDSNDDKKDEGSKRRSRGYGLRDLLINIKNMFNRYLP